MLLKEVRVLTDLQVISESRDTGVMCIRGTFQRAEEANHNQRIYPKAVLENCVKNLGEKLKGRELVGELDHPADGVVKLQNASHLITKLEWQGNDLIGEAEILPTPAGQIAKSLINAGVKIGISSRGMGTLSESVKGPKIVNDDYKMITFDLVADPSTKGAYPSLAESRQHAIDFVENVIKPAISEKAFVARLKKALNENKTANTKTILETTLGGRVLTRSEEKALKRHHEKTRDVDDETLAKMAAEHEEEEIEEMCGPKHNKKKNKRKLKPMVDSVTPLTLSTLMESWWRQNLQAGQRKSTALDSNPVGRDIMMSRARPPKPKFKAMAGKDSAPRRGPKPLLQKKPESVPEKKPGLLSRLKSGVKKAGSAALQGLKKATIATPPPSEDGRAPGNSPKKAEAPKPKAPTTRGRSAAMGRSSARIQRQKPKRTSARSSVALKMALRNNDDDEFGAGIDDSIIPLTLPSLMEMEVSRTAGPGETGAAKKSLDKQTDDFLKSRNLARRMAALKQSEKKPPVKIKAKLSKKLITKNGRTIVPKDHPAEDSDAAENQRGTQ